jgi:hypothetical protein
MLPTGPGSPTPHRAAVLIQTSSKTTTLTKTNKTKTSKIGILGGEALKAHGANRSWPF